MLLFQWDAFKAAINFTKHGVSFSEASTVLSDPDRVEFFDNRHSDAEDRFWALGCSEFGRVLLVVYTFRSSSHGKENHYYFRVISARLAKKGEIQIYRQSDQR